MMLSIEHHLDGDVDVVTVTGNLDIYSAPELREHLASPIGTDSHDVVVDIAAVPVLDSMGLGVLVGALKRARTHGGVVRLAGATPMTARTLRITGLSKVFSLCPDAAAAVADPYPRPS